MLDDADLVVIVGSQAHLDNHPGTRKFSAGIPTNLLHAVSAASSACKSSATTSTPRSPSPTGSAVNRPDRSGDGFYRANQSRQQRSGSSGSNTVIHGRSSKSHPFNLTGADRVRRSGRVFCILTGVSKHRDAPVHQRRRRELCRLAPQRAPRCLSSRGVDAGEHRTWRPRASSTTSQCHHRPRAARCCEFARRGVPGAARRHRRDRDHSSGGDRLVAKQILASFFEALADVFPAPNSKTILKDRTARQSVLAPSRHLRRQAAPASASSTSCTASPPGGGFSLRFARRRAAYSHWPSVARPG